MKFTLIIGLAAGSLTAQTTFVIDAPMPPPAWALAERELLKANAQGVREFADKFLDDNGYLQCVERWGGNDGPDDAMENFSNWTLLYALGASESVINLYKKAWEAHLRQYTAARAEGIEMAQNGMYHREFITAFDWEHTGEGLAAFHFYSLGKPGDMLHLTRVKRFAGFYTGEDPQADNYDSKHKIIKSIHNGSRGAKITPATRKDWGGLPVEGAPDRLTRYATASNIAGDHPLNLCATTLAMNAYMLTGEGKYRDWLLEYTGAWRDRVLQNGGNIPTNIGLDGTIGGGWGGKWYGGVFGWNFWPQSNSRNYYIRGPRVAFGSAFLLTRDAQFIEPLRQQVNNLYAAKKVENGRVLLPNKHGDDGWYGYRPSLHFDVQRDVYLWSLDPADKERIRDDPWIAFLDGHDPDYPLRALRQEFGRIQSRVNGLRQDTSTPDTRGSDYSQRYNPAATTALVNLTLGANEPGRAGNILHSQVRYFDPEKRRAGLPDDVAALVSKITPEGVTLTLVNTHQGEYRTVIVQAGAYGEHQFASVASGAKSADVDVTNLEIRLAPGAGDTMTISMRRYVNQPTLAFPWARGWRIGK